MKQTAYIGLGSNMGDRLQNLAQAVKCMEKKGIEIECLSSVYETEPQGIPDQPWFLNMVARINTSLHVRDLLNLLRAIEDQMGRQRHKRWGPRLIDLDILLFGKEVVKERDLEVPHPRLSERAFVLIPMLEIDEDVRLPDGKLLRNCLPEPAEKQNVHFVTAFFDREKASKN